MKRALIGIALAVVGAVAFRTGYITLFEGFLVWFIGFEISGLFGVDKEGKIR